MNVGTFFRPRIRNRGVFMSDPDETIFMGDPDKEPKIRGTNFWRYVPSPRPTAWAPRGEG